MIRGPVFGRKPALRPRILNLTSPDGREVYELHLIVKSKIGVLHEITGFLAGAKIDIVSMHIQAAKGSTADIVAFLEMDESKMSLDELLRRVKDLDCVQEANAAKRDRVVFEEFLFPIMVDEDVRGFLMTDGAWMSIATRLMLTYGTGGLAILYEAGVACGEEYAKHLQKKLGLDASPGRALENLSVMLRAAGMGITDVRPTVSGFSVSVKEPLVPSTETKIHDHFLTGVIAGAVGYLNATSYVVDDVRFEGNELGFALGRKLAEPASVEQRSAKVEKAR
jgi:hypothetical protein